MWVPESRGVVRQRYDLPADAGRSLSPKPFGTDVALGPYPVTVLDQASAMATFAAGGLASRTHFVRQVTVDSVDTGNGVDTGNASNTIIYSEPLGSPELVLGAPQVADLSWALSQNPSGKLPDRPSASKAGVGLLRDSLIETAHAWMVGYTPQLGMAVWIGNEDAEFPLKDKQGARVTGTGLPSEIYRKVMSAAHEGMQLPVRAFPEPAFAGDPNAVDAAPAGDSS